jgi:predicted nuclease of predicted toxin-antitoxin system
VNFLFDNNLPAPLAEALRLLSKRVTHVRDLSELGPGATDDLILDYSVQWGYVVITRDTAIRRQPHFQALLKAKKVAVVFVRTGSARQMDAWQIAKLIVKAWDDIERFAGTHSRPFIALLQQNGRVARV